MSRPVTPGPLTPLVEKAGGMHALAKEIGVQASTLWRWQRGHTGPRSQVVLDRLAALAAEKGVDVPRWGAEAPREGRAGGSPPTKGWVYRNERGSYATDRARRRFSTSLVDAYRWDRTAENLLREYALAAGGKVEWR